MLHRHLAKLAAVGLFLAACSGAPATENSGSSNSALRGGNGNGQGDDCQDDGQGDDNDCDGRGDQNGHGSQHCQQSAHVQLISMDNSDLITGTNLVTLQTQQYQLVFGSTRLVQANLATFPQTPVKTAAQAYDSALASGNQSSITTSIQNYANVGGRAQITFTQNIFGQRMLTSFAPVAN
jgi:hypothetical protein